MAENVTVEKIEATAATTAVVEADRKVADLKAEKAAKKAKKQNDRLTKWKWKGAAKVVNYVENNVKPITIGMAVGGPAAVLLYEGGKRIVKNYKAKHAEEAVAEPETIEEEEANEAPFDTEA